MVSFLHIADKNDEAGIVRNGIRVSRPRTGVQGVYAVPVIPDFTITHQWARELKRSGVRTLVCVQFRIPNQEPVWVGKYNAEKVKMTAAEAVSAFQCHVAPFGLEALIPRKIRAAEIQRTYPAPRITGWRYYPEAKGKPPFCRCRYCNRGEIRAQRLIRDDE